MKCIGFCFAQQHIQMYACKQIIELLNKLMLQSVEAHKAIYLRYGFTSGCVCAHSHLQDFCIEINKSMYICINAYICIHIQQKKKRYKQGIFTISYVFVCIHNIKNP